MPSVKERNTIIIEKSVRHEIDCYHCGTVCMTNKISIDDKYFCCEGCKLVYEIINNNGLCDYYKLQSHPGLTQIKGMGNEKYAYLDDENIAKQLYKFTDGNTTIVTFYIPGIHCSSCMWLLEHMYKINPAITESRLNFSNKEVTIHFQKKQISIRQLVELLTTIGYEPYISLEDTGNTNVPKTNWTRIIKLGIAGFCFGNIMMMSFPEYLTGSLGLEIQFAGLFRYINLFLSIPVFFYCASEFFSSAWAGLRQKMLNIDAPIALALIITYTRSIYEIATATGSGYLDSMSGIVFFMLVGRAVQERTYRSISFHRDYKSYFPIAVNVITENGSEFKNLQDLKEKDIVQLYHEEVIPADGLLLKGEAKIDYSFVSGESEPVQVEEGAMMYAGGKLVGEQVTIQVLKPVASSYLTSLWNHYAFKKDKSENNVRDSVIHKLSKYFTYILFFLAAVTAVYWAIHDPSRILPSVSAMLIIACPCALLLSATYTNGNLLRILSINGLFLRDASVIEQLGNINHIVFDKTGTLTQGSNHLNFSGHEFTDDEKDKVYSVAFSSKHPYSKALVSFLGNRKKIKIDSWKEHVGKGIEATIGADKIFIGSALLADAHVVNDHASFYVRINNKLSSFVIKPTFRTSIDEILTKLKKKYDLSLLSGDNNKQEASLRTIFGEEADFLFNQQPIDKLEYIEQLQEDKKKVMMIGDGLNDSGALQQSNAGVTLTEDINNFTPSCDAILDAKKFSKLPALLRVAKSASSIINFSFTFSILYNFVGLYFAVQGKMSPVIAAILMPISTISIVLITTIATSLSAKRQGLSINADLN